LNVVGHRSYKLLVLFLRNSNSIQKYLVPFNASNAKKGARL
jgi:hypothetical protein